MPKSEDIINLKESLKQERANEAAVGERPVQEALEWAAPSHEGEPATKQWKMLWGIISLTAVAVSVIFGNYLFALFVVIASIALILTKQRPVKETLIRIDGNGLMVGEKLFRYHDITSFWVDYEPPLFNLLIIKLKRGVARKLGIPLAAANPVQVRRILLTYVPEVEEERSIIDVGSKFLKL